MKIERHWPIVALSCKSGSYRNVPEHSMCALSENGKEHELPLTLEEYQALRAAVRHVPGTMKLMLSVEVTEPPRPEARKCPCGEPSTRGSWCGRQCAVAWRYA